MSIPAAYDPKMDVVRDEIWENAVQKATPALTAAPEASPFLAWIRIAAVFIVLLLGAWLFALLTKTEQAVQPAATIWVEKTNPKGQRSSHLLPDGTKVWLNVASQLVFPEQFSDTLRQVKLTGEAFFDVAQNPEKPFVVETNGVTALVLGTSFNVHAYSESPEIKVALLEGKVQVQRNTSPAGQRSILSPGEELSAPRDQSTFIKSKFQYEHAFGWKEGILIFDGVDFAGFRKSIENWYGVTVELKGKAPSDWSLRARYQRATLQHVLEDISFNKNMDFQIKEKTVLITF